MAEAPIPEVLDLIRAGKMYILVDDPDRENEGDLCVAAEFVTPEIINFMATHARGWICLALDEAMADRLDLPEMVSQNNSRFRTNFTVTIEAATGVTTGISAADRARTVQIAVRPDSTPTDLVRPGHIQPIRARDGGVLVRTGQTEGSVDLSRMAGCQPAAVICEIMNEDGTMARMPQLEVFAEKHGIKICSVTQIIQHRRTHERMIEHTESVAMPTAYGDFELHMFRSLVDERPHFALSVGLPRPDKESGNPPEEEPVLVRPHSECLTGDVFHSLRCDCGFQLERAMQAIQAEGRGVVLYMRQEGRGIGIENKIRAYKLQDEGMDTVEANHALGFKADQRDYGIGAQILRHMGVRQLRILTNNPRKFRALQGYGLAITERVPLEIESNPSNEKYLRTKRDKLGHMLADDS
ncbi:MAG: bifunctional 3,4-dihydroxy-2-butanone-4-phosphate synthase/GTP cyclohydrolase II [Planctomycetota bacterium]|nr:bifunctional 3,4-dihydroxy-2-butanone-4-phosphate synthase/GTP cyclohydrolase II [Planctomycetota bacterium]